MNNINVKELYKYVGYLASPYSPTKFIYKGKYNPLGFLLKTYRYIYAAVVVKYMLKRRMANVISPIVHSHFLHILGLESDWEFWEKIDFQLIDRCDYILVLKIDGWKKSKGVNQEIKYALSKGKKVFWFDFETVSIIGEMFPESKFHDDLMYG